MPPDNGFVSNYSHTREGATVTYTCDAGFRPSMEFNSTCSSTGYWTPDPEFHNCTLVQGNYYTECIICLIIKLTIKFLAFLTLSEFPRGARMIECPGDTIRYNCSVLSNSETVQLTWRVTLPGMMPRSMTYSGPMILMPVSNLGLNISTNLTSYRRDEYIESIIELTVLRDIFINGTILECISEALASESERVVVMQSGTVC